MNDSHQVETISVADRTETSESMLPSGVQLFSWVLLSLVAVFVLAKAACRKVLGENLARFPYKDAFLGERFPDLLLFLPRFQHFHHPEFFTLTGVNPFLYPAPLGVVYELFYKTAHPLKCFLCFVAVALLAAGLAFGKVLRRRGLRRSVAYTLPLFVLVLSMPVWFELIQANMEITIWVFVTSGLAFFFRRRGYSAAACFGVAAAMKIYPIAYLGLFLIRKRFGPIVVGGLVAAGTTVTSLWLLGGSIGPTWLAVSNGVAQFRYFFMLQKRRELAFDHSLLSLLKLAINPFPAPERFAHVLTIYLGIVALLGAALFFLRVWRLPVINQVLFLAVACTLLPPVSFEYTLLHLFVPLALLVLLAIDAARQQKTIPGLGAALVCMAVLLAPLSEVIWMGHGLDGQIKAVTLAVLLVLCVTKPYAIEQEERLLG